MQPGVTAVAATPGWTIQPLRGWDVSCAQFGPSPVSSFPVVFVVGGGVDEDPEVPDDPDDPDKLGGELDEPDGVPGEVDDGPFGVDDWPLCCFLA